MIEIFGGWEKIEGDTCSNCGSDKYMYIKKLDDNSMEIMCTNCRSFGTLVRKVVDYEKAWNRLKVEVERKTKNINKVLSIEIT